MSKLKATYDLTIVGGGIVGLATARQVSMRHPKLRMCIIEKEKDLATHQSARNSGVVHRGIYYKKNSLKSKFCIKGAELVQNYCQAKKLPYLQCGKLIVATKAEELETLNNLYKNASANKIKGIEMFNSEQIQRVQPECTKAIEAIWSANTAIVDWRQVALSYANDFTQNGGTILTNFTACSFLPANKGLLHIPDAITDEYIETKAVINCAGLFSDYFARKTGNNEHPKVVPFRGKYYLLGDKFSNSIRTNIYPVPNPKFPFLGVHVTPRIDGSVLIGPTAMLVSGYERYQPLDDIKLSHMWHIFVKSGLRKLLGNKDFLKATYVELRRNKSKKYLASEVEQLLPGLMVDDLIDTDFCGIRAQVIQRDGELVDDFLFETGVLPQYNKVLHVRNCPSPAATSSLAIAERVANILEERII